MLTAILLFIMLLVVLTLWWQGLWGNAITLINVTFAAMFATNLFEPVVWLFDNENSPSSFTYLLDFLVLWGLFTMSLFFFRLLTDFLSRYRVRFNVYVENIGRTVLSFWIAWLVVCFTCFTLHTAPLGAAPFLESFQSSPETRNFLLFFSPDRQWMAFVQSRSREALRRSGMPKTEEFEIDDVYRVFDQNGDFIPRYHHRREMFEEEDGYRVNR
jgi:hypothetical protein